MNAPRVKAGGRAVRGKKANLVSPARSTAFTILRRVEEEGAFASVLLATSDDEMRADDRALCYELVMGCLRWQLWLDHLIEHYAGRKAESLDAPVRRALRLGLYQLRFLRRIPASAVVNESVNLAYTARVRSAAPFINAVLRRATREPEYNPATLITNPIARVGVETSHPAWLIERWVNAFGLDEASAFARANNDAPPVAFRLTGRQPAKLDVLDELRSAGATVTASLVAPNAWRIEGASARLRELARQGFVYVQDEASQLVASALGAQSGERVLDVCAAPGSKTTHIATQSASLKLLVAGDLHAHRLRVVRETSKRLSASPIQLIVYDATTTLPFTAQAFDRVLVDAPCTGTGTLRRNPEIRWRISPTDIAELSLRQQRILHHAAQMVAPGGLLIYSTCSIEIEENEAVVASFLERNNDWKKARLAAPLRFLNEPQTAARTWPQREGADGFYIAALERRS